MENNTNSRNDSPQQLAMWHIHSRWVWFVVSVIYAVGLAGFLIPAWHGVFVWLIPFNILFAFVILLLGEEKLTPAKGGLFLICFLFGYVYELAGTKTGLVFGEYTYGDALGIKILDVPLLIGVNWFFMVYASLAISARITASRWGIVLLAPAFMLLYDYFLEPFAIQNGMWHWSDGNVPPQNYVAWYAGGLLLCTVAVLGKFDFRNRFAAGLFVVQALFFAVLFMCGKS